MQTLINYQKINYVRSINIHISRSYLKKLKKVYHSQLGYFYIDCDFKKDEAILYEQTPFNLIEISKIYSLDYLSEEIKEILDKRYKEKIDNETKMNKVKNWDGFLDIQGKRDQKIDQIIK